MDQNVLRVFTHFGRMNSNALLGKNVGGVFEKSTWFLGGSAKNHVCPQGGRESQKCPKICPHGLWIAP